MRDAQRGLRRRQSGGGGAGGQHSHCYARLRQELPEYFEDHLADWMAVFMVLLQFKCPAIDVADDDATEPGVVSTLQAGVVECAALLMSKEEEAFQPYIEAVLSQVTYAMFLRTLVNLP